MPSSRNACVMGWPVGHSLSPKLHNYWLKEHGIDAQYEAWPVKPENLQAAMQELLEKNFIGCNLTLPHKELVLPMLGSMDDTARAIGAANTIVVKDGKLHGMNTDAFGFMENIRPALRGRKRAVVIGAGGAARAVAKALADEEFEEIIITNRTLEKAHALAKKFGCAAAPWQERSAILEHTDLLVNATSLGMKGEGVLSIDLEKLPKNAIVTDIVYSPLETDLLRAAKARGNSTVDGLGMLLHQAVPAFEAWYGIRPEVTGKLRECVLA